MSNEPNQAATMPGPSQQAPGPAGGPGHTVSKETRRRVIAASFIGNFVEWFDYAVYGYLAVTIAAVFFPESESRKQRCC